MANNTKKYVSLSKLETFLEKLAGKFAAIHHRHTVSDITDYTVDNALSSTSSNPVENKVIDAEFEAVSTAMNALDSALDNKAEKSEVNTAISNIVDGTTIVAKANHAANADSASSASQANVALMAVKDANANFIHETYITDIAADGHTLAVTKGAGASAAVSTIDIKDKVYTATSTDGKNYTVSVPWLTELTVGASFVMIPNMTNTSQQIKLTVNSFSQTGLYRQHSVTSWESHRVRVGFLEADCPVRVMYDGYDWVIEGRGIVDAADIEGVVAKAESDASGQVITDTYETKTDASDKLAEAKTYAETYANGIKNDLLNGAGAAYDTLKELGDLIDENVDAIEALETVAAGKQDTITGAASTIVSENLTANRALVSNSSGKVSTMAVTIAELANLIGTTSNIQTQLNSKANSSDLANYYAKTEIDNMELITIEDIDTICGATIQVATASEVTF